MLGKGTTRSNRAQERNSHFEQIVIRFRQPEVLDPACRKAMRNMRTETDHFVLRSVITSDGLSLSFAILATARQRFQHAHRLKKVETVRFGREQFVYSNVFSPARGGHRRSSPSLRFV